MHPEKLENLSQFIARFGYKVRTSGTKTDISKSINHLLDDIHGKSGVLGTVLGFVTGIVSTIIAAVTGFVNMVV